MKKSNPVSNLNQEEIEMLWQEKGAKDWYSDRTFFEKNQAYC